MQKAFANDANTLQEFAVTLSQHDDAILHIENKINALQEGKKLFTLLIPDIEQFRAVKKQVDIFRNEIPPRFYDMLDKNPAKLADEIAAGTVMLKSDGGLNLRRLTGAAGHDKKTLIRSLETLGQINARIESLSGHTLSASKFADYSAEESAGLLTGIWERDRGRNSPGFGDAKDYQLALEAQQFRLSSELSQQTLQIGKFSTAATYVSKAELAGLPETERARIERHVVSLGISFSSAEERDARWINDQVSALKAALPTPEVHPWKLEVNEEALTRMGAFGLTLDMHAPGLSRINGSEETIAAFLRREGIPATTSYGNDSAHGAWVVRDDNRTPNGITILSPVLQGQEGIKQTHDVVKKLQELGLAPTNQASLSIGAVPDMTKAHISGRELSELPFTKLTHENGVTAAITPENIRASLGADGAAGPLLFRGTMHIDGNLSNRSKEELLYAATRPHDAITYIGPGSRSEVAHTSHVLPPGFGFLHVYEEAPLEDRPYAFSNLEDAARMAKRGKISDLKGSMSEIYSGKELPSDRYTETILAREDKPVATFLVHTPHHEDRYGTGSESYFGIIDIKDIPSVTLAKIHTQMGMLDSQYISKRSPDDAKIMAIQTQFAGDVWIKGSRIVVPRFVREGENGQEIFVPNSHVLWDKSAQSSRGNPLLVEALLPKEAHVPQASWIADSYRQGQQRLARSNDAAQTSPLISRSVPWQDHHPSTIHSIDPKAQKNNSDKILIVEGLPEKVSPHEAYALAKTQGNKNAAYAYVEHLFDTNPEAVKKIVAQYAGQEPVILPVTSIEKTNAGHIHNAIPEAYAVFLSEHTGWPIQGEGQSDKVIQISKAGRTGASKIERFVRQAYFQGHIEPDRNYMIIDDHSTNGGTLRNLLDYVEINGGKVIGASTLTQGKREDGLRPTETAVSRVRNLIGKNNFDELHNRIFGTSSEHILFTSGELSNIKVLYHEEFLPRLQRHADELNASRASNGNTPVKIPIGKDAQNKFFHYLTEEIDNAAETRRQEAQHESTGRERASSTTAVGSGTRDSDTREQSNPQRVSGTYPTQSEPERQATREIISHPSNPPHLAIATSAAGAALVKAGMTHHDATHNSSSAHVIQPVSAPVKALIDTGKLNEAMNKATHGAGHALLAAEVTGDGIAMAAALRKGDSRKAAEHAENATKEIGTQATVHALAQTSTYEKAAHVLETVTKSAKVARAFGEQIPVIGGVVALGAAFLETGTVAVQAAQGHASWTKVASTAVANVAEVAGSTIGFGVDVALREGVVAASGKLVGEQNTASHSAVVQVAQMGIDGVESLSHRDAKPAAGSSLPAHAKSAATDIGHHIASVIHNSSVDDVAQSFHAAHLPIGQNVSQKMRV